MKEGLSVLIPVYNCRCARLVAELQRQCANAGTDYEIVVADDGSTDRQAEADNRLAAAQAGARYVAGTHNVGRAAIRNRLARLARHDWLVFCDGDMSLRQPRFIADYLAAQGDVVYGGYTVADDEDTPPGNLRQRYERRAEPAHSAERRSKHPLHDFHTSNFMVKRTVMEAFPFDERFRHYGFEDVLWGKVLGENGVTIRHIDNPLCFADFEDNARFVDKTEESLRTLHAFSRELQGFSGVLDAARRLEKWHLSGLVNFSYKCFSARLRRHLEGNNPSVFLFNIYKLLYFVQLRKGQKE